MYKINSVHHIQLQEKLNRVIFKLVGYMISLVEDNFFK